MLTRILSGVRVKYSPDFKANYQTLPAEIKTRFMLADALVCNGDLKELKRQGWMYFVDLGTSHAAFGTLKEDNAVFYWMFIGSAKNVPVIL